MAGEDTSPTVQPYSVRKYDRPALDDLEKYVELIIAFEKRFFRNVNRGQEILDMPDINAYIEEKRRAYDQAKGREKEVEGGMLCSALVRRLSERAVEHIQLRIEGRAHDAGLDPATPEARGKRLNWLTVQIAKDFTESARLNSFLRFSRGHPNKDAVLEEMQGEPFNIFLATLTHAPEKIDQFYENRYFKIKQAMKCIDSVTQAMAPLDACGGSYQALGVKKMLMELAGAAKRRCELQRSDPDFYPADLKLCALRDEAYDLLQGGSKNAPAISSTQLSADTSAGHVAAEMERRGEQKALDPLAALVARDAVALIYDVAMTQGEQPSRVEGLSACVQSLVERARRRGGPVPMSA